MKLHIKCSNCDNEISFWTWSLERVDLKMKHGDKITLTCKNCNKTKKYFINNIKAKESKLAIIISALVFIIGTPCILILLWDYFWQSGLYAAYGLISIIGIPSVIHGIINKNDNRRVRIFNNS